MRHPNLRDPLPVSLAPPQEGAGAHTEPPLMTDQNIGRWGAAGWLAAQGEDTLGGTLCYLRLQWGPQFTCDLAATFAFAVIIDWALSDKTADAVDLTQA